MPLTFDFTGIHGFKELCYLPDEHSDGVKYNPVTETLIYATMSVGINTITEKNYEEFYARYSLIQDVLDTGTMMWGTSNNRINGELIVQEAGKYKISLIDIYQHIGLSTNASNKTKQQFLNDIYYHAMERAKVQRKLVEVYTDALEKAGSDGKPFLNLLMERTCPHNLPYTAARIKERQEQKATEEKERNRQDALDAEKTA